MADVIVAVRYVDAQGAMREVNRRFIGRTAAGTATRWATGLGPFTSTEPFRSASRMRASIG